MGSFLLSNFSLGLDNFNLPFLVPARLPGQNLRSRIQRLKAQPSVYDMLDGMP